jgi:hypothetical protein
VSAAALPGPEWIPFRVFWSGEEPYVEWTYAGERRLLDPFFESSIELLLSRPFNQLFRWATPMRLLAERARAQPGLAPNGFIFHMSRCGSTLVSQMLAALPQDIVVSEAPPIDTVLQARHLRAATTEDDQVPWLRWMMAALGVPRNDERHFFVKLDAWHTLALPLIRRAFPDVPWVFLYRDPVEVLVSHDRQPGTQMVPSIVDPRLFGFDAADAMSMPAAEYRARVLARICEAALQHADSGALFVDYRELPEALASRILPHFGVAFADADLAAMNKAAQRDAKTPMLPFAPDSESKQSEAGVAIREAAETWLAALYRELEVRNRCSVGPTHAGGPANPGAAG